MPLEQWALTLSNLGHNGPSSATKLVTDIAITVYRSSPSEMYPGHEARFLTNEKKLHLNPLLSNSIKNNVLSVCAEI